MEGFYTPSEHLESESDYKFIISQIATQKLKIGLACFTETYENVLMWSHYAGNYTGICLSYDTQDLISGLPDSVKLVRLSYVDEPPVIYPDHVRNTQNAAVRILSQKKYNWAYEREWRILGPIGKIEIGRVQAVKEIYFGSRVALRHRQKILSRIQGTQIRAFMMDVDGYEHTWQPINAAAKKGGQAA